MQYNINPKYGIMPIMKDKNKLKFKNYMGIRIVKAVEMDRNTYYKNYQSYPYQVKGNEDGYMIVYADDFNLWLTKDIFEEMYREVTKEEKNLLLS